MKYKSVSAGKGRAMFSYWMDKETRRTHASLAGTQWGWRWVQISEDDYYRAKENGGRVPIEDNTNFYCSFCHATRECISCWHNRRMEEKEG